MSRSRPWMMPVLGLRKVGIAALAFVGALAP